MKKVDFVARKKHIEYSMLQRGGTQNGKDGSVVLMSQEAVFEVLQQMKSVSF